MRLEMRGDEPQEPDEDSRDHAATDLDDQALQSVKSGVHLNAQSAKLSLKPVVLPVDPVESLFKPLIGPVPGHRLHDHRRP